MSADPVRAALYSLLTGDAPLIALLATPTSVYHRLAPRDALAPFVVFDASSWRVPTWTFAGPPVDTDVWLVKAIDRSASATAAEGIAARLDTLLNDAALTITGRALLYLRRQSGVNYGEQDGAEMFTHCGALYRLVTDPA